MEKKAGVQRCGTWESSRDNFHLISYHQKLLHKIIVNYGSLLCIWFPTAATTAVTFLKIKCMFHLLAGREEGKKVKKEKFMMENPLKCPVPYRAATACPWPCSGTSSRGHAAVSPGRVGRVRPRQSQSCVQQLQYVHSIYIPRNSLLSLISSKGHYTKQMIPLPSSKAAALTAPATARSCARA